MRRLVRFSKTSILFSIFLMFFGASAAMATTFSFKSYTGIIGARYPAPDYSNTYYEEINGTECTALDIVESLGTVTDDIGGGYIIEFFRGQRGLESSPQEVTFGSSVLSFEAAENSNYDVGQEFLLGTLTFTNGLWNSYVQGEGSAFSFTITASSETANLYDQVFSGTLMMFTNGNDADIPQERADWFYIQEKPELGSIRVLEAMDGNSTGSIEFWGAFGSLHLLSFENPQGGAFLDASITPDISNTVPEPATLLLIGLGLLGVAGVSRKKN